MIFEVRQATTTPNMVWFAVSGEKTIATAISPLEKGHLNIVIDYLDGSQQRLHYNPNEHEKEESIIDKLSFKIFQDEKLVGAIVGKNKRVKGFLQSYPYRVMTIHETNYFLYEVGFGSEGLYLCIYKENELITIVEKELRVVNYKDRYTAYCYDQIELELIMPLILYYDITVYGNIMNSSVRSVQWKRVYTIQKELISKYDPTFIPRIKEID